ncbi:MAG: AAA family ATPase [Clostridia bacterium]|nr:AAA family ATPase [Clostridia bacterium]
MSNYHRAKEELLIYIKARTPFIVIESGERERAEKMLFELATENRISFDYYTEARQLATIGSQSAHSSSDIDHDPLEYAMNKFKKSRNNIFAIGDITRIENDNAYSRELLNLIYLARESSSSVIIITADPIWSRLSALGVFTKLDYPNHDEIAAMIDEFIEQYKRMFRVEWTEADISYVATVLKGLSEIQLQNILSAEIISKNGLYREGITELAKKKDRLFGDLCAVQKVALPREIRVSGMENLKEWLVSKRKVFFATDAVLDKFELKVPKGILLSGVPGCGKSFCSKMIAKEWGLPLYKFDIGNLFDKWMGESERKMREALDFIDNVSPCVIWIDEIEKMLSTSDTSNDTGNRVLGQFLFWLQESHSRVFLVATANNVRKLPPELFRKGRFSEIFFADLPTECERADTVRLYCEKSLHMTLSDEDVASIVAVTDGYSYSDIEMAIKEVAQQIIVHPDIEITIEKILSQIQSIVPIAKSNPELVEDCREWGRDKAISVSKKEGN